MIVSVSTWPLNPAVDEAPFEVPSIVEAIDAAEREVATWWVTAPSSPPSIEVEVLCHDEEVDPDCARGICRAPVIWSRTADHIPSGQPYLVVAPRAWLSVEVPHFRLAVEKGRSMNVGPFRVVSPDGRTIYEEV
jgi:hypothetical protein